MNNMLNLKKVTRHKEESSHSPEIPEVSENHIFESAPARNGWRISKWLALGVIAAVIVVSLVWVFSPGPWRAVFLTNNQVYFGRFTRLPFASTITLGDVYYLQMNQPLQQGSAQPQNGQSFSVVKLGGEIHGPKGSMVIPMGQILFWEDLRNDSPVVQAIQSQSKK